VKIKKLTLRGFKSFADETEVELHDGITAIVGPNGCGKSNISDAIRWVLGEQAPSAIRGARMEEAIFGGTAERRPISRAEVNLVLSNEDRSLPIPRSEVEIGRTVYRGGESDYRLNGEVVRLKDIQELCRDTGLGATEYSIIEGRMVDAILSDRAEERRAMFEEAAEIGRYKDRRRTALRRLDQARDDLERLEDVIGEVRTKVRSLAQQRGRAERHREYRERRRRLEVAVAQARLESLDEKVERAEEQLEELRRRQPAEEGELQERETRAETLRVEIAELERERSRRAGELEEVRGRLEERERRRIVASERATAAEERIEAIGRELQGIEERREELASEEERLQAAVEEERDRVEELSAREAELEEEVAELEEARDEARGRAGEAEDRLTELAREVRLLEADREAGGERVSERSRELERRREELSEAREATAEQERELHEARREAERAAARREDLEGRLQDARSKAEERREALRELRDRLASREGELSADRARAEGLAGMLGSGEDLPPAVGRLLEAREELAGVHGVLAEFVEAPAERAAAVEACLGTYLHGVVVDDWEAVRRVRSWLDRADDGDAGGVLLLPLEPGPRPSAAAGEGDGLLEAVRVQGEGAPWARALLGGVDVAGEGELSPREQPWTRPDGSGQDPWGAVRLGRPSAAQGVLERRAELRDLRSRIEGEETRLEELREERREAAAAAEEAEDRVEALESALAEAERVAREAEARRESVVERRDRAKRDVTELERRIGELEDSLEAAESRAEGDEERLEEARRERDEAEARLEELQEEARRAQSAWEERRGELHERQLRLARRESELSGAEERLDRARSTLRELEARRERLESEREERRGALRDAGEAADESEEAVADLLERRRELEDALTESEEELAARKEALEEVESWLREARRAEREHADRRHELELELAELRGQRGNIRERIEGEWDEPLEELADRVAPPEEGGPDAWSEELEEVRRKLARLGPVNLLAEEEYEEERERLDFLEEQKADLVEARDDLHESIRRINREAATAFQETFEEIQENFQFTFRTLFEGGECDLWLEDPEDPLDSPIEISASPRGKRTQRIHLLSGGERALTALSLLFAIYLAKPSPFCIMDEVDAPLDENNILRFVGMLERFKDDTQFIVITHNPRTIEAADWIYGVTMQEPGVSSVVGVELGDLPADRLDPEELAAAAAAR
jgi:chromosome segregation protein